MDPITTAIVAAAVAGVTSGTSSVAQTAIVDTYSVLKATLRRKFGSDSELHAAVERLESNPDSSARQDLVKEEVEATNANNDSELLQLAQNLIEALQSTQRGQAALKNVKIDAHDSQIGLIGDQATVEGGINFGDTSGPE